MAFIVYEIEFGTAVAGSLKPSSATAVLNAFSLLRQARGMTFETEIILVIIPADLYPSKAHWAPILRIACSCIVFLGLGTLFCCLFFCPLDQSFKTLEIVEVAPIILLLLRLLETEKCLSNRCVSKPFER